MYSIIINVIPFMLWLKLMYNHLILQLSYLPFSDSAVVKILYPLAHYKSVLYSFIDTF